MLYKAVYSLEEIDLEAIRRKQKKQLPFGKDYR